MFEGCSQLNFLYLKKFNTQNVKNMNSIFSRCDSLKYLYISSFNMEKVENTEKMFEGIEGLRYINLEGIKYFDKNILENNINNIKV